MKLIFVRHGKSLANANATIGVPDTKLAEEGIDQARKTGQDLRGLNVTAITCSPFIRAQQTAELIAGELGIAITDITIIDELHERRMGKLEGGPRHHDTIKMEFFYENDTEFGFESQAELIARINHGLAKVKTIASQTSGATLVVGHAVSTFYSLQIAQGRQQLSQFDAINQMDNAEFIELYLKD